MEQGTDEWFAARCGKVTASRVADVVAKLKNGKRGASREMYMGQLIAERLSGEPVPSFSSAAMQWGTEIEPMAREAYEFAHDVEVAQVGFIDHPSIENSGASPDGMIGDDGLIEIKAPNTSTHIDTLLGASIQAKYIDQMQWQMACTGRKWCDFVSFDPRMPHNMSMFVKRIERDDERIGYLEESIAAFLKELDDKVNKLKETYGDK